MLAKPSDWEHHEGKAIHIDLIEATSNRVAGQSTRFISIYAAAIPIARNSIQHEQSAILLATALLNCCKHGFVVEVLMITRCEKSEGQNTCKETSADQAMCQKEHRDRTRDEIAVGFEDRRRWQRKRT